MLVRRSLQITYGTRQRDLADVKDLPGSIGSRDIAGERMFADAYVDVPPQTNTCRGSTPEGGVLRIVDVPLRGGGTAAACIQYCRVGLPTPPPARGTPATETIIATPVTEPKRSAVLTPTAVSFTEPMRKAVTTALAQPFTEPKRSAVLTPTAVSFTEPKRKAVTTALAQPFTEPKRAAVQTVLARPFTEPKRKAVPTVAAQTRVEPPLRSSR
jgi:hypothetical protein